MKAMQCSWLSGWMISKMFIDSVSARVYPRRLSQESFTKRMRPSG